MRANHFASDTRVKKKTEVFAAKNKNKAFVIDEKVLSLFNASARQFQFC